MLYFIKINLTIRHEKKDNAIQPCDTLQKHLSNNNFNVADTNRIMKMHVAKQMKLVIVLFYR